MFLIFDTETTGLPKNWKAPITDTSNWPRCIQIAWQLHDKYGNLKENKSFIIKPDGFDIPYESENIHGISTDLALAEGHDLINVLESFNAAISKSKFIVGHNINFDLNVIGCEFYRLNFKSQINTVDVLDTCSEQTAELCKLPGGRGGKFKLPTLTELHEFLFDKKFKDAHNASADVEATSRCLLELIRIENFNKDQIQLGENYFYEFKQANPNSIENFGIKHLNLKKKSEKLKESLIQNNFGVDEANIIDNDLDKYNFCHLHNHTQFSMLQSTIKIRDLVDITYKNSMNAVAITDLGNMMGAFRFISEVKKVNQKIEEENKSLDEKKQHIKPIIGCVLNVCEDRLNKNYRDNGYQMVFLAKNKKGYDNLSKLSSLGFTEGFYYVPRVDKELILKYKSDLIVLSGNLYGEIASKILKVGKAEAEQSL